jgi:hypothetical protein
LPSAHYWSNANCRWVGATDYQSVTAETESMPVQARVTVCREQSRKQLQSSSASGSWNGTEHALISLKLALARRERWMAHCRQLTWNVLLSGVCRLTMWQSCSSGRFWLQYYSIWRHLQRWMLCTPLSVNVFVTLATL